MRWFETWEGVVVVALGRGVVGRWGRIIVICLMHIDRHACFQTTS